MKKFIILLMILWLFPIITKAADCDRHPIFCHIKQLRPKMHNHKAFQISNAIHKASRRFNVDKHLLTAIFRQESNFKVTAIGRRKGLVMVSDGRDITYEEQAVMADFGISQIYYKTAVHYKFDIKRLTTDLQYSINAGAKVLSEFKKQFGREDPFFWLRYNCGARGTTNRDTCQIYKALVERYAYKE